MRHVHVEPLPVDRAIARWIANHTTPPVEQTARVLTWAADERILYGWTVCLWAAAKFRGRSERIRADHLIACAVAANVLPHLLKAIVDQKRPDRCVVHGPGRGIPHSGRAWDAFPSGHAVHVGALASALSWMHPQRSRLIWGVGGLLAATRIIVLAHWASDVVAGLATGIAVERLLRPVTRARLHRHRPPVHPT